LGAFVAGQMLSCVYYGLFLVPYLAVVCGTMLVAKRALSRERLVALAVARVVAALAGVPARRAHPRARKGGGERGLQEVMDGSALPRNYLAPPEVNLLYGDRLAQFREPERRLFPGFAAIALALVALWPTSSHENTKTRKRETERFRGYSTRLAYLL